MQPKWLDQLDPTFTEPQDGWWPLENVQVGDRIGKLLSYTPSMCRVVIGGHYVEPVFRRVATGELVKVHDLYNRRLRGDVPPPPLPKLQQAPAALSEAMEISSFTADGYDTSGEWTVFEIGTGRKVQNFTVKADGKLARRFTLDPGTYEIKRRA